MIIKLKQTVKLQTTVLVHIEKLKKGGRRVASESGSLSISLPKILSRSARSIARGPSDLDMIGHGKIGIAIETPAPRRRTD